MSDDFKVEPHDFSVWTKVDDTTHSRTCSKCKKSGETANYTEIAEQVLEIGDRIYNIERMFNKAAGMKPEDDRLPKRLLQEPVVNGPSTGMTSQLPVPLPSFPL